MGPRKNSLHVSVFVCLCVCCVHSGAWALLIDWVGGGLQGIEASSAQILQFSRHAEKCMIKAQLTCLKRTWREKRKWLHMLPHVVTAS